ncbi:MAG: hypothetical protein M3N98_16415 [Actinomycetota bacterium]|nr:hypothetical protein [Actinomycetota bacterium]
MASELKSGVWLLKNRMNPFPVRGEMTLSGGRISLVVTGGASCIAAMREHLEEQTGVAGLAERLKAGEAVQVLEFAPEQATISWPAVSGGYVAVIEVNGKTWNVAMAYPSGGAIQEVLSLKKGRKLAKEWKAALP